jgi:PhnB protein
VKLVDSGRRRREAERLEEDDDMANVKGVPEGFHAITVQLAVEGAAEAIEFYKKAFGAQEIARAPDPTGKKVWHAHLKIGDSAIFVNDVFPDMGGRPFPAQMWFYSENVDGAFKRAVDAGAKVMMPVSDMFWGDRLGKVGDRWGNEVNLAQRIRNLTPDEMKKAQDEFVANIKKGK